MSTERGSPHSRAGFVRSASLMGGFTFVSRVLGYIRDSLNAALFGAGMVADAYFVAFRIPNLLRDLVGEGALSAALLPSLARRKDADAHRLASTMLTIVVVAGIAFVAVGLLAAPWVVAVLAPGFHSSPGKFGLTVTLTRLLLPFIVFISLAAVVMGLLNSREKFGAPAFAPVALNISIILAAVFLVPLFGKTPEAQVYGWTAGVLLGGLAQWLVQVPSARRLGFRFHWRLSHPGVGEVGRLMTPAMIGYSVAQIHLLVNTILASLLPEGSVACLYYGNRLMQLPLGVFGVALSTAAFPVVARAFGAGRPADARKPLEHASALAMFTVLPASAGLVALAPQINGLLFRFGRFDAEAVATTAAVSVAYAVGIIGHALTRVLTPAYYAAGKAGIPVRVAVVSVVANALLSVVLMLKVGIWGLPLSTSLVSLGSGAWLFLRLKPLVPGLGSLALASSGLRSLSAAVAMGAAVWLGVQWAGPALETAGWGMKAREAILTGGGIGLGVAVYAFMAWILRIPELHDFLGMLRRRRD